MSCIFETENCESYASCPTCSYYMDKELFEAHFKELNKKDEGDE